MKVSSALFVTLIILGVQLFFVSEYTLRRSHPALKRDNKETPLTLDSTDIPSLMDFRVTNTTPTLNLTALWLGEYSQTMLSNRRRNTSSKSTTHTRLSVVISHCTKPLKWISDFLGIQGLESHNFTLPARTRAHNVFLHDVTVISKCGHPVVGAVPGSEIVRMSNLGRCDHSYASWMLNQTKYFAGTTTRPRNADAENTMVLFIKDNDYRVESFQYRSFLQMWDIVQGSGFACAEPPPLHPKRARSAYHIYNVSKLFTMNSYDGPTVNSSQETRFRSSYENFGHWADALGLQDVILRDSLAAFSANQGNGSSYYLPVIPICYGGIFSTTLAQVLRNNEGFYEKILSSLSRGDNIEEGHFVERSWAAVLSRIPHPSLLASKDIYGKSAYTSIQQGIKPKMTFCDDIYSLDDLSVSVITGQDGVLYMARSQFNKLSTAMKMS